MPKIFISQPMNGKTDDEILNKRAMARIDAEFIMGERVDLIDSFFQAAPHEANPLWFLGRSLELLSNADAIYFCDGWENARGCRIEHECAQEYGVKIIKD